MSIGWKSFVVRVNELLNNGKGSISVKKIGFTSGRNGLTSGKIVTKGERASLPGWMSYSQR